MRLRDLLSLPIALLLAGCGEENCPALPGGIAYCLQVPASGPRLAALQHVVIEANGHREILLARIENGDNKFVFVGLTPLGQTVLTLTWDGKQARAAWPPGMQPRIEPAVLVAMMQMALWPVEVTRRGLPSHADWREDAGRLRLSVDGRAVAEIERRGPAAPYDSIALTLPVAQLVLNITTLPEEDGASSEVSR